MVSVKIHQISLNLNTGRPDMKENFIVRFFLGWWRVMLVYIFGVLSGSLWCNVYNPRVFLSGASGGVYALITAHLGTVIMNFR